MRRYQPEDDRAPRERGLLLTEYAEGANPHALITNNDKVSAAVGLTAIQTIQAHLATNSTSFDAWPHWGINEGFMRPDGSASWSVAVVNAPPASSFIAAAFAAPC